MVRGLNSRVVGAGFVGLGLVAGAWMLNSLQSKPISPEAAVSVATVPAPARAAIPVSDSNNDGVEDWREPLLTAEPVILNAASSSAYERSNTLTERVGIALMENYFMAKSAGSNISEVNKQLTQSVLNQSLQEVYDVPYTNRDITIVPIETPETTITYLNAVALTLQTNDVPNLLHNLRAFEQAFLEKNEDAQAQLRAIASMYQKNCLDLLELPVPTSVRNEHLLLLNAMCAMSKNVTSMVYADNDPALALLRLKRYEADETALAQAVVAYRDLIQQQAISLAETDPARVFVNFGTNLNP